MKQQFTLNPKPSKLPGLCQHEIVSGILKNEAMWSRASQCPVSHLGMGVRISVFAPYLCDTSYSGLDEYVDGCLSEKGADWYPFCVGGGIGRGG